VKQPPPVWLLTTKQYIRYSLVTGSRTHHQTTTKLGFEVYAPSELSAANGQYCVVCTTRLPLRGFYLPVSSWLLSSSGYAEIRPSQTVGTCVVELWNTPQHAMLNMGIPSFPHATPVIAWFFPCRGGNRENSNGIPTVLGLLDLFKLAMSSVRHTTRQSIEAQPGRSCRVTNNADESGASQHQGAPNAGHPAPERA